MKFVLVVSLLLAMLLASKSTSEEFVDVCRFFDQEQEFANFTLEMSLEKTAIELRMPIIFFEDRWKRIEGNRTTARFFTVDADNFEPRTRAQNGALNKIGKLNSLGITIGDTVAEPQMGDRLTASAQLWQNWDPFESFDQIEANSGLREVVLQFKKGQRLFVGKNEQKNGRSYLICTGEFQVAKVKGCRHYFRSAAGIDVAATYAMSKINQWLEIKRMIDRFLICSIK